MNTFGNDVSKILSAREQAHDVVGVPVIKAYTISKTAQKETEQEETEQEETEQEESEV